MVIMLCGCLRTATAEPSGETSDILGLNLISLPLLVTTRLILRLVVILLAKGGRVAAGLAETDRSSLMLFVISAMVPFVGADVVRQTEGGVSRYKGGANGVSDPLLLSSVVDVSSMAFFCVENLLVDLPSVVLMDQYHLFRIFGFVSDSFSSSPAATLSKADFLAFCHARLLSVRNVSLKNKKETKEAAPQPPMK